MGRTAGLVGLVRDHNQSATSIDVHLLQLLELASLPTDPVPSASSGSTVRQALSLVTALRHARDHERPGLECPNSRPGTGLAAGPRGRSRTAAARPALARDL